MQLCHTNKDFSYDEHTKRVWTHEVYHVCCSGDLFGFVLTRAICSSMSTFSG
jgi:hypothetical protein